MERASRKPPINIMLDSGAYSAWRTGRAIDLVAYCDYIQANQEWLAGFVNLDVINPEQPEVAAAQGYENYTAMRARGLKPIPVYHAFENISWLHRYLDAGCDYIGLSATSLRGKAKADLWYAQAWQHLVDRQGLPLVKVHAFGEGRAHTLRHFPWFSADSRTWLYRAQRNGGIRLTDKTFLSFRADRFNSRAAPDVHSLGVDDAASFESILKDAGINWNFDSRATHPGYEVRTYLTCLYYLNLEKQINAALPIRYHPTSLFNAVEPTRTGLTLPEFRLHLAQSANIEAQVAFAVAAGTNALFSFNFIQPSDRLKAWVYNPQEESRTNPRLMPSYAHLQSALMIKDL